ncbi:hypothetical protein GPSY_0353 [Paraglaciecola psychrophila 170]|nr:hypothetical protein GPSY_0353 [Paraglaciecola psychrophila 170]
MLQPIFCRISLTTFCKKVRRRLLLNNGEEEDGDYYNGVFIIIYAMA